MLVATSAQTRAYSRGSGSIHVFKGHYKSDKPDGVIPREEAEVRHYAMETSISGGIVATIRFSLFPRVPHTVLWCARVTRAKISARRKSVSRTGEVADASPTRFDVGIRFECVRFAADRVYSYPHPAAPLTGQPLPILDQLIGSAYVSAFQRNARFSRRFVHRVSSKSRRIS